LHQSTSDLWKNQVSWKRTKLYTKTINTAKITNSGVGKLFDDYSPKISSQIINKKFTPRDREAIKNLALGSLTRTNMSKCDSRIFHYCIECSKNPKLKYKQAETIQHFLNCHKSGPFLKSTAQNSVSIMDCAIKKKQESKLSLNRTINQCKKYHDQIVHNELVDIMLGIGKIQVFASVANKKTLKEIESFIYNMQEHVLLILKDKNRLSATYFDRVEDLIKEQEAP